MNEVEVIDSEKQLPESIDKLSAFVMVSEEKVQAMRAQIRAIDKVGLAEDVYKQKVAEAQELSKLAIEAAERLGEELLKIPTRMGQRTDLTSVTKVTEVKTKTEITQELGLSHKQVLDYQQMALNPEAVQKAIDDAIARGDVVSRSQVMKEIGEIKRQLADEQEKTQTLAGIRDKLVMEKADLRKELKEKTDSAIDQETKDTIEKQQLEIRDLKEKLEDQENKTGEAWAAYDSQIRYVKKLQENPPQVEVPVVPKDYEAVRARCAELERKNRALEASKDSTQDRLFDKEDEVKRLKDELAKVKHENDAKSDDIGSAIRMMTFSYNDLITQMKTTVETHKPFMKSYREEVSQDDKNDFLRALSEVSHMTANWLKSFLKQEEEQ